MSMEIHYTVDGNNTVTTRPVRTQAHIASVSLSADARPSHACVAANFCHTMPHWLWLEPKEPYEKMIMRED